MSRAPVAAACRPSLTWWLGFIALLSLSGVATADRVQEVIDATRFAYGLESAYWEDPGAFSTYDKLYAHYRQGFSPELAAAMAAHTLASDGDLATWVPEQVFVAELGLNQALVWFPTPTAFAEHGLWGLEDYMHVRLRREGGRWVVYWGRDKSAPPAQ